MVWLEKEKDSVSESVHLLSGAQALPLTCIPTRNKKYSNASTWYLRAYYNATADSRMRKSLSFRARGKSMGVHVTENDDVIGSARRHVVAKCGSGYHTITRIHMGLKKEFKLVNKNILLIG